MIGWLRHLSYESMNLLMIVIGGLSVLGIASDVWSAMQVEEDTDDAEIDHVR